MACRRALEIAAILVLLAGTASGADVTDDRKGRIERLDPRLDLLIPAGYVLDGSATFVVGGTVVDGKATAPDEIRGRAIHDGYSRHIAKGDVIIVPSGTPHWFKDVPGPIAYYVVKVR
jgi:hypothetical protein